MIAAALAVVGVQDGTDPTPQLQESCELHVWPGSKLGSVYSGWVRGGIVNGAVTGRDGYPRTPADAINTGEQAELLKAAELQTLLKLDTYRVVMHAEALPSSVIRRSPARIAASPAPCYAELIVDDVMIQHDAFISGKFLKVLFRYREFGRDAAPTRTFGTWVQTRLVKFPPTLPEQEEDALAEVRRAFSKNITAFAAALRSPAKKH
ncbi:hypothetical protein K9B35_05645 [Sphingomonas sp. R647]|uniref:hypothetical protein n=1 Tax=Sphingomonas sp. R647 TaxID=2875233 RepID=UPI001CD59941|nr:hypothetical protein [Sphingomonas sp. R647]MCA1197443.1 hypothetical protein [Sphingomonas sp. R647]